MSDPYYPSQRGLGVAPLFRTPVELLALSKQFFLRDGALCGRGGIHAPPPVEVRRVLKRLTLDMVVPEKLSYLVESTSFARAPLQRDQAIRVVMDQWFFTADVFDLFERRGWFFNHHQRAYLRSRCRLKGNSLSAIQRETTMQFFSRMLDSPHDSDRRWARSYFRKLDWLRAMLATWDAVCISMQVARRQGWFLTAPVRRALNRLRDHLVAQPFNTALTLKGLAHECRSYYFGGAVPSGPWSHLTLGMSRKECLAFSYLSRALPSPLMELVDEQGHWDALQRRLQTPSQPLPEGWQEWVRSYWARFRPKEISYSCQPSTSGCLGHTRTDGGHRAGYTDLILVAIGLRPEAIQELYPLVCRLKPGDTEAMVEIDATLHKTTQRGVRGARDRKSVV